MSVVDIFADIHLRGTSLDSEAGKVRSVFAKLRTDIEKPMQVRIDASGANRSVQAFSRSVYGSLRGMQILGRESRNALIGIGAAVALAVREYAKQEKANEGLRSALRATGNEVEGNFARYDAMAKSLRSVTTESDDAIKSLITLALNLGVSAKQADEVAKAGVGLGKTFFSGDSERGTRAAALAIQGQTRELTRLIPALKTATSSQQMLAIVSEKAAQGLKEANDDTTTFSGSMQILKRDFDDAAKVVGGAFAPDIRKAAALIEHYTEMVRNMTPEQKKMLVDMVELTAVSLGTTYALAKLGTTMAALKLVFGESLGPISSTTALLGGLGAVVVELGGRGDTFAEKYVDSVETIKTAFRGAGEDIKSVWTATMNYVVYTWYRAHDAMFGGDAKADFANYIKGQNEVAAAAKAAQDKQTADHKAGVDARVRLTQEGASKEKATFTGIADVWKRTTLAILNGQRGGGAGGGIADVFKNARPGAVGGGTAPATQPAALVTQDKIIRQMTGADTEERRLLTQEGRLSSIDERGARYAKTPEDTAKLKDVRQRLDAVGARKAALNAQYLANLPAVQAATGEDPARSGMDPAQLNRRMVSANKELKTIPGQIENYNKLLEKIEPRFAGSINPRDIQESVDDAAERAHNDPSPANKKSLEQVRQAQSLLTGRTQATERERQLRRLIANGGRDPDIAMRPGDRDNLGNLTGDLQDDQKSTLDAIKRAKANGGAGVPGLVARYNRDAQMINDLNKRFAQPQNRNIETPEDKQNRQLGPGGTRSLETASKDLKGAAGEFSQALKNMRFVGVVK